jgi:hypothetical protein
VTAAPLEKTAKNSVLLSVDHEEGVDLIIGNKNKNLLFTWIEQTGMLAIAMAIAARRKPMPLPLTINSCCASAIVARC